MKIILAIIIFGILSIQATKAQEIFPKGNFIIEYKEEVAGKEPLKIMLYKNGNVYKFERTEKNKSFTAVIDYEKNKHYEYAIDKNKIGNQYNKINYILVTAMWRIYYKGIDGELKLYQKLPDIQTVAGKECEVYDSGKLSIMNSTMQYFFSGEIMLKMEKPGHVIEAVEITENPIFEEGFFYIPEDIEWISK